MSKGRPPKKNAVRRGGKQPDESKSAVQAVILDAKVEPVNSGLQKPDSVQLNPIMSRCWDDIVSGAPGFETCDIPLLESYCYWYAVLQNAMYSTMSLDGQVSTIVADFDDEGNPIPSTARPNPDLKNAEKATDKLRQLGDALNISPTARVRSGLMRAMTVSTAADLASRTRAGAELFAKEQRKLNAAQ